VTDIDQINDPASPSHAARPSTVQKCTISSERGTFQPFLSLRTIKEIISVDFKWIQSFPGQIWTITLLPSFLSFLN
jgi:hypothetical protein